jgi:hypothetical protein
MLSITPEGVWRGGVDVQRLHEFRGAFHTNGMTKTRVRTLRLVEHAVEGGRKKVSESQLITPGGT